jgi:hypothetical protein
LLITPIVDVIFNVSGQFFRNLSGSAGSTASPAVFCCGCEYGFGKNAWP